MGTHGSEIPLEQVPDPGWGRLPLNILDNIKAVLEASRSPFSQKENVHDLWSQVKEPSRTPLSANRFLKLARLVNKHWARWATKAATKLTVPMDTKLRSTVDTIAKKFVGATWLVLRGGPGCSGRCDLKPVAVLQNVTSIDITCHTVRDENMKHVVKLRHLTSLNLRGCKGISAKGLTHLTHSTSLTRLNLEDTRVKADGFVCVGKIISLRRLDLWMAGVTDECLAVLGCLPLIQHLGLSMCRKVTDMGLAHVGQMTSLAFLDLSQCQGITAYGIRHLAQLTGLTELDLSKCRGVGDDGLNYLDELTGLQKLNLRGCEGVTDAGLGGLVGLKNLRHLDLARCGATEEGVMALREMAPGLDCIWGWDA